MYYWKRQGESLIQKVTCSGKQHYVKSSTLLQDKLQV